MSKGGINYGALFTLRSDGRYQGYWHELDRKGRPTGRRHTICDRDPERLFERIREKETPGRVTFGQVLEDWEGKHRDQIKEGTWKNYAPHVRDLKDRYGDLPVAELVTADVIRDLAMAKAAGYSYTVVNTRRCIWRMALDSALADPTVALPYNVAVGVKNPTGLPKGKRRVPPQDALEAIIADAGDMSFGFIPFFLLCTGLRRNEALRRRVSDLNTQTWELEIPEAKTEAGVRTVPIIEPLRPLLQQWIEAHPGPWLFPYVPYNGRKGEYMTDSNWETGWDNFCAAHGWLDEKGKPAFTVHALRHGTATLLYEAGVDIFTMQRVLGHADVATTMKIYAELRAQHEKKNVAKYGRAIRKMMAKAEKAR